MSDNHTDAMISRLEKDIEERNSVIEGVIAGANDADRDLTEHEKELTNDARKRIEICEDQLKTLYDSSKRMASARKRAADLQTEFTRMRAEVDSGPVEYRSAGEWVLDAYKAQTGDPEARQRLEVFTRAAAHQKTGDNPGIVPDPVVGSVINFIDAARPIVNALGARPLPAATWHRPRVTQHTAVGPQGTAGGAGDEKAELVSQKMTISRLTANAVTYGGYVNVSRQNIDLGSGVLDTVINDLAAQYAIETEAATAAALATTTSVGVTYPSAATAEDVSGALWEAAGTAYSNLKGQGRLILAVAPDVLSVFGPLFAPVNPQNAQSSGLSANNFGQGAMGSISGVSVVMSSGLAAGEAFCFSTAAIEAYEQRVGTLQVTEPSVLGTQVGYAGYFTPLKIEDGGIIPVTQGA